MVNQRRPRPALKTGKPADEVVEEEEDEVEEEAEEEEEDVEEVPAGVHVSGSQEGQPNVQSGAGEVTPAPKSK